MKKVFISLLLLAQAFSPQAAPAQTATPTPICCLGVGGIGGLNRPTGLAVNDAAGYLYVADSGSNTVKIFTSSGTPVTSLGTWSGDQLNYPVDTSVDNQGNIFVVDNHNSRLVEFSPQFAFLATVGIPAGEAPEGVWADNAGPTERLYVTLQNGSAGSVLRYDWNGSVFAAAVSFGMGSLNLPAGVVKRGNLVYVADGGNVQVVAYTESGNSYSAALTFSDSADGFNPRVIRADLAGYFYVGAGNCFVFNPDFTLSHICIMGSGFCWGVVVDQGGTVFAGNYANNAVTEFQGCVAEPSPTPSPTSTPLPTATMVNPPDPSDFFIYPSPAQGSQASVSYDMAQAGQVDLRVWNEKAELVARVSDQKPAGVQVTPFSISGFATGVYFYSLTLTYGSGQAVKLGPKKFVILH